jgi:hypothetical protein
LQTVFSFFDVFAMSGWQKQRRRVSASSAFSAGVLMSVPFFLPFWSGWHVPRKRI